IDDVLADFIAAVDAIPAEVTADDIESITAARNSYTALGEFFQGYVPAATLEKLENAEQACKNFEGTLNVTTYGGTVLCNDRPYNTAGEQYSNGTEVKLSAVPDTGYKFIAWINTSTNNIIGTDAETNVTVAGQTNIQAVFGATGDAAQYTVVVRNKNYLVYNVYYVDKGNSITLPTPSSVGNYEFVGWKFNGSDFSSGGVITESGIIYPVYQLKESDAKYTVTVLSGTKTPAASADGKYKYNEKVTVTANEPSVGTYFAGWTKNGVIVSFDREYSFYVCNDVTVCATYSETAPQIKPQITMTDVITSTTNGKAVISFVMERTMPSDGYVYVESGLIVTVSTGKVLNLETAASDSSIKVCKSGYATPNGQLKINVITPSGHADAVGYLTYINIATGDTVTIYTDNYHGQVEIGGIESGEIEF
ncbi:MAG: hypothetical protein PUB05_03795, partial [Firmicutes bacterium]|nr:hypothetical protein [Bacillota bacterium]